MLKKYFKNQAAFTMLELSVVLIVIGLLVAATLTGQALLENSETKTLLSEVQKLNSSIGQFQALYKALPGDMPNATSYWSTATNGDGSGKIDAETGNEPFAALQQLYLAKLIDGAYAGFTGTWGSGFVLSDSVVTGNVIGSKGRDNAALYIKCCSGPFATTNYDYSRTLTFKNYINVFSIYPSDITKRAGILTPTEALFIDKKVDDGVPDTGLVGGSGSWTGSAYAATGCYTGTGSTSTYDAAVTANKNVKKCQMQFAYDWD